MAVWRVGMTELFLCEKHKNVLVFTKMKTEKTGDKRIFEIDMV